MNEQFKVPIHFPVDDDNFLRRQCPACSGQFKWHVDSEDVANPEPVDQYFCPRCGAAAAIDDWSTPEQREHAIGAAGSQLDQLVQDILADTLRGTGFRFEPNPNFSLDLPDPEPLVEPNDMTVVISPCHPEEPLKVPDEAATRVHCLACGQLFAT